MARGTSSWASNIASSNDENAGLSGRDLPARHLADGDARTAAKKRASCYPCGSEKDFAGGTSLFGGGGYTINPGSGNRDFWQAGIAATQDVSKQLSVGAEITRQGSDTIGDTAQTRAGVGAIVKLSDHYALLFSGGPTWAGHQNELPLLRGARPLLLRRDDEDAKSSRKRLRPLVSDRRCERRRRQIGTARAGIERDGSRAYSRRNLADNLGRSAQPDQREIAVAARRNQCDLALRVESGAIRTLPDRQPRHLSAVCR